jgi:hypothetical protein
MKLKTPHILTLLVILLATLYLLLESCAREPQQIFVISETVCQPQQPPTYFGAATISPPAFPLFGIPTRPLRELGGWRVNYGI